MSFDRYRMPRRRLSIRSCVWKWLSFFYHRFNVPDFYENREYLRTHAKANEVNTLQRQTSSVLSNFSKTLATNDRQQTQPLIVNPSNWFQTLCKCFFASRLLSSVRFWFVPSLIRNFPVQLWWFPEISTPTLLNDDCRVKFMSFVKSSAATCLPMSVHLHVEHTQASYKHTTNLAHNADNLNATQNLFHFPSLASRQCGLV